MYEHITYEILIDRMIKRALTHNKNLDSREGSLLFLGEAPAAVELQYRKPGISDPTGKRTGTFPDPGHPRRFGNDNYPVYPEAKDG